MPNDSTRIAGLEILLRNEIKSAKEITEPDMQNLRGYRTWTEELQSYIPKDLSELSLLAKAAYVGTGLAASKFIRGATGIELTTPGIEEVKEVPPPIATAAPEVAGFVSGVSKFTKIPTVAKTAERIGGAVAKRVGKRAVGRALTSAAAESTIGVTFDLMRNTAGGLVEGEFKPGEIAIESLKTGGIFAGLGFTRGLLPQSIMQNMRLLDLMDKSARGTISLSRGLRDAAIRVSALGSTGAGVSMLEEKLEGNDVDVMEDLATWWLFSLLMEFAPGYRGRPEKLFEDPKALEFVTSKTAEGLAKIEAEKISGQRLPPEQLPPDIEGQAIRGGAQIAPEQPPIGETTGKVTARTVGEIEAEIRNRINIGIQPKGVYGDIVKAIETAGGKIVPSALKQTRNRVKHPEAKALMLEIERADELWHRRAGQAIEGFRQKGLYKMSEKDAIKLADDIEAGRAKEYSRDIETLWFKAKAKGLTLGKIKNYFPRIWKQEIMEKVYDDAAVALKAIEDRGLVKDSPAADKIIKSVLEQRKSKTNELAKHLLKSPRIKSYSDALDYMTRKAGMQLFTEGWFEKPRLIPELPPDIYERNAKVVLPRYADALSKRIAEVEIWGNRKYTAADKRLRKIGEVSTKEEDLTRKILQVWTGKYEREHALKGTAKKIAELYTAWELTTKIGLGTATIPNTTQTFISTIPKFGVWNTLRSGLDLFNPETRSMVRKTGVLRETVINTLAGKEPQDIKVKGVKIPAAKIAKATLKVSGFTGINKINFYLATATAHRTIPKWYKQAQTDNYIGRLRRKQLAKMGVDYKQKLTKNRLLEKSYRFGVDSQLQRNVLNDPLFFNDPRFRPFVLFKRFGYRQAAMVKDMLWAETFKHGNPAPLLRIAALGYLGGEFVGYARRKIKELLTGDPQYSKHDLGTFNRMIEAGANVGWGGFFTDMIEADEVSQFPGRVRFFTEPVALADANKVYEGITRTLESWDTYEDYWITGRRGANQFLGLFGSLPRYAAERLRAPVEVTEDERRRKSKAKGEIFDRWRKGKGAMDIIARWDRNNPYNLMPPFSELVKEEKKSRARKEERKLKLKELPTIIQ